MTGAERIIAERARQLTGEAWTAAHDTKHDGGELALAAACYAVVNVKNVNVVERFGRMDLNGYPRMIVGADAWPWAEDDDKRNKHAQIRCLVIAGALLAAEIDRLLALGVL